MGRDRWEMSGLARSFGFTVPSIAFSLLFLLSFACNVESQACMVPSAVTQHLQWCPFYTLNDDRTLHMTDTEHGFMQPHKQTPPSCLLMRSTRRKGVFDAQRGRLLVSGGGGTQHTGGPSRSSSCLA
jgi:hypothetical protein